MISVGWNFFKIYRKNSVDPDQLTYEASLSGSTQWVHINNEITLWLMGSVILCAGHPGKPRLNPFRYPVFSGECSIVEW